MPVSDYLELNLTGFNVDHVRSSRSILSANYGEGYKDTTRVGAPGGVKKFSISSDLVTDDENIDAVEGSASMEYYWQFFEDRLDNANEPFIIDWRNRKWLVDFAEPEHGVEILTSDLFTPDGIELNLRRVRGLPNMPDGSVFDPTIVAGVYGWYLDAENVPGTPSWSDQSGNGHHFTADSGDVLGVANVQNGHGVARFSSTTNDGKITSSLDATIYEMFIVLKMREATFSNFAGILSGSTFPNNVLLVGGSGDTKFLDLGLSSYTYKKNGATRAQSNQEAPMNTFGVVHVRVTGGIALTDMQLGCDRDFSGRFGEVDIGEIVLCDDVLADLDSEFMDLYLMTKWGITPDVPTDDTPPSVPMGLTADPGEFSVELTWSPSTD